MRTMAVVLLLTLALAGHAGGEAAGAPRVVASVAPVHALVAGVMAGVGEPVLLVRGGGSPHSYSLRPSDARALHRADVVFWVGEGLERFLVRALRTLGDEARVVALAESQGVQRLPQREGGAWEHGEHAGEEAARDSEHAAAHEAASYNPHVWLDPRNAQAMVRAAVAALSAADPGHAARYARNAESLEARLAALDDALAARLAPVRDVPYVVFHDAYAYLEARYGLRVVGAITVSPERSPGARRVLEIRERLRVVEAACVFAEPQFEPRLVRTVVEGTGVRVGTLDPLGATLPPGQGQYFTLMHDLAQALVSCLAPGR